MTPHWIPRALFVCLLLSPTLKSQAIHAPDGGTFERLQSVIILPKPGAPFSATVVTTWTRSLADGTTTTIKNHRLVARDSAGHVFQERRYLTPDGDKQETRLSALEFVDPTRHEFLNCDPANHVCIAHPDNRPATVPVQLLQPGKLPNGNGNLTRENLGTKNIANLDTVGTREITTINPGGPQGYQVPEPTIKEFWYSPRLEVNVVTQRFEPRGGAQSITLENISLAEPDPRLFTPPTNYRVVDNNFE